MVDDCADDCFDVVLLPCSILVGVEDRLEDLLEVVEVGFSLVLLLLSLFL